MVRGAHARHPGRIRRLPCRTENASFDYRLVYPINLVLDQRPVGYRDRLGVEHPACRLSAVRPVIGKSRINRLPNDGGDGGTSVPSKSLKPGISIFVKQDLQSPRQCRHAHTVACSCYPHGRMGQASTGQAAVEGGGDSGSAKMTRDLPSPAAIRASKREFRKAALKTHLRGNPRRSRLSLRRGRWRLDWWGCRSVCGWGWLAVSRVGMPGLRR